jgi:cell division protein FtsB
MRLLALLFAVIIAGLQYPLWIGKGSWLTVWKLDQQLSEKKAANERLQERNHTLEAEVVDLKTGSDAIEERARFELSMIRNDEVFFQILDRHRPAVSSPIHASQPAASTGNPVN